MPAETITKQSIARELADAFEAFQRKGSEEAVYKLKDGSPEWMAQVCLEAHGNMMPDDERYRLIRKTILTLCDAEDWDDLSSALELDVDIYTTGLIGWLASHVTRYVYCEEAMEDIPVGNDFLAILRLGQLREREEIAASLVKSLRARLEEMNEEADE